MSERLKQIAKAALYGAEVVGLGYVATATALICLGKKGSHKVEIKQVEEGSHELPRIVQNEWSEYLYIPYGATFIGEIDGLLVIIRDFKVSPGKRSRSELSISVDNQKPQVFGDPSKSYQYPQPIRYLPHIKGLFYRRSPPAVQGLLNYLQINLDRE